MPTVTIVGTGAITPLGATWSQTRRALLGGEVAPEGETIHDRPTRVSRVNQTFEGDQPRFAQLAQRALQDLPTSPLETEEGSPLGLVASTSKGGVGKASTSIVTGLQNPGLWASSLAGDVPRSIRKIGSPNTACATGLTALIQGSRWILDGTVDEVVIVATESCFHPVLLAGYQQLGVFCDEKGMRPFHPDRSGFALGEAAAAVHLADGEYAQSRDLDALATIEGWGETADAHHMTQMDKEGRALTRALNQALEQANQNSENVDLLHAHLTTTETNDVTERTLLENWSGHPLLQAIKPSLGHTIGAAGLLEAIATVDVLQKGRPFPLPTARPEDVPDVIEWPDPSESVGPETGVTWNMGFGGHNAALLLRSNP